MHKKFILTTLLFSLVVLIGYKLIYYRDNNMQNFSKTFLDQRLKQDLINKKIWNNNCPISLDRLNLLKVSYVDFEGIEHHDGMIMVLDVVADHVLEIFKTLYAKKFPINSINLINDYNGSDEKSMEANNSSAFSCRLIQNSSILSIHSYGLAIDINPEQNPFLLNKFELGKTNIAVYPPSGMEFINRRKIRTGMVESVIDNNKTVVDIFSQHGFTVWGGDWIEPLDWHHFQVTREQAAILVKLSYQEGVEYFNKLTSIKDHREK